MPPRKRISDEAVKKATGKDWQAWFALLDKAGAREMSHRDTASLLSKKYLKSSWWAQAVTVEYEYERNKRIKGRTAANGFEVGAAKTIPISAKYAWDFLMSPEGLCLWLGDVKKLELRKGATYRTRDGLTGEIRSVTPGRHIRLTRQPLASAHASVFQMYVLPAGAKASIRLHEEKLKTKPDREKMKQHWQGVLKNLAESFTHPK